MYLVAQPHHHFFNFLRFSILVFAFGAGATGNGPGSSSRSKLECTDAVTSGGKRLLIHGPSLRLSELVSESGGGQFRRGQLPWPSPCSEHNVKELLLFSANSVELDVSLNGKGRGLLVSVIAPHWEVVVRGSGVVTINLDGEDGAPVVPSRASFTGSYNAGERGASGRDGNNGGDGGQFIGLYSSISYGQGLAISAVGGRGSDGQHGGTGAQGRTGNHAHYNTFPSSYGPADAITTLTDVDVTPSPSAYSPGRLYKGYFDQGKLKSGVVVTLAYNHVWYSMVGTTGGVGGDGGTGGKGGGGGRPGRVDLFYTSNQQSSLPSTSARWGTSGRVGEGGQGGEPGVGGDRASCKWLQYLVGVQHWVECYATHNPDVPSGKSKRGMDGSEVKSLNTEPRSMVPVWRLVHEYSKVVLNSGGGGAYPAAAAVKFLSEIQSPQGPLLAVHLKPLYFAKEVLLAEEFSLQFKPGPGLTISEAYYASVAETISKLHHQHGSLSSGEKLIGSLSVAVALSKLGAIREHQDFRLKGNSTEAYFSSVVAHLAELERADVGTSVVATQEDIVRSVLDGKIRQLMGFLNGTLLPRIGGVEALLQKESDKLVEEISRYLEGGTRETSRLNPTPFERTVKLGALFEGVQLVGGVLTVMGQVSAEGATRINEMSSPAVGLSFGVRSFFAPFSFVGGEFDRVGVTVPSRFFGQSVLGNKLEAMTEQVGIIKDVIQANWPVFGDLGPPLLSLNQSLVALKGKKATATSGLTKLVELLTLEGVLEGRVASFADAVSRKEESIKKQGGANNILTSVLPILSAMKGDIWLATSSAGARVSSVVRRAADPEKKAALHDLFHSETQGTKQLETSRKGICDQFDQLLKSIAGDLRVESGSLAGSTRRGSALLVRNWDVRGIFLKQIKVMLKNLLVTSSSFDDDDELYETLKLSFDALDHGLVLLIELYEILERFEEVKLLAAYVANANSPGGRAAARDGLDSEMGQVVRQLEYFVRANWFVAAYQRVLHTFKQWVFPYAKHYLQEEPELSDVWSPMRGGTRDAVQVLRGVKRKVEKLAVLMGKYQNGEREGGGQFQKFAQFSSINGSSSRPFFVWQNDEWGQSIRRFLSGEEVLLTADPNTSTELSAAEGHKSALKFKTIELSLKTRNPARQAELDRLLLNNYFQVSLTHSGVSRYGLLETGWVMLDDGPATTSRHDFGINNNNGTVAPGGSSEGRHDGGPFLYSPYTLWTIKLEKRGDGGSSAGNSGVNFSVLETFKREVDLELGGTGSYIDEAEMGRNRLLQLDLMLYYGPENNFQRIF